MANVEKLQSFNELYKKLLTADEYYKFERICADALKKPERVLPEEGDVLIAGYYLDRNAISKEMAKFRAKCYEMSDSYIKGCLDGKTCQELARKITSTTFEEELKDFSTLEIFATANFYEVVKSNKYKKQLKEGQRLPVYNFRSTEEYVRFMLLEQFSRIVGKVLRVKAVWEKEHPVVVELAPQIDEEIVKANETREEEVVAAEDGLQTAGDNEESETLETSLQVICDTTKLETEGSIEETTGLGIDRDRLISYTMAILKRNAEQRRMEMKATESLITCKELERESRLLVNKLLQAVENEPKKLCSAKEEVKTIPAFATSVTNKLGQQVVDNGGRLADLLELIKRTPQAIEYRAEIESRLVHKFNGGNCETYIGGLLFCYDNAVGVTRDNLEAMIESVAKKLLSGQSIEKLEAQARQINLIYNERSERTKCKYPYSKIPYYTNEFDDVDEYVDLKILKALNELYKQMIVEASETSVR